MTKISCNSKEQIFNNLPGMSSGPVAFLSLIFSISFKTPFGETFIEFSVSENLLRSGFLYVLLQGCEKTLENWLFKTSAFSFGVDTNLLLSTRSETPVFSLRWLLI